MPMVAEDVVDILDRLAAAGVSVSVAGGWAIEALLGRVTRDHGDLDLAVDATDVDRAIEAMAVSGLRIEVDERPARLALGDGRRAVDLHPVQWDADGTGRQATGSGGEFVYPPGSTEARGWIGNREVRCLTPELLVTFHLGYEPRDIDRRDMAALAEQIRAGLCPTPTDPWNVARSELRLSGRTIAEIALLVAVWNVRCSKGPPNGLIPAVPSSLGTRDVPRAGCASVEAGSIARRDRFLDRSGPKPPIEADCGPD